MQVFGKHPHYIHSFGPMPLQPQRFHGRRRGVRRRGVARRRRLWHADRSADPGRQGCAEVLRAARPGLSANRSTAQSISVVVITSGGAIRIVDPCVSLTSTPRSASRRLSSLPVPSAGSMSTPAHSPRPRTASTPWPISARSRQCSRSPSSRCALLEFAASQHRHHGAADRGGKRVAAERRAVLAWMQHPENVAVGHHRGQRHHAAAQRLAEQIDVGHHTPVVAGECPTGTGQAGLDLVGDHENVVGRCRFHAPRVDSRSGGTMTPASPWIGSSRTATVCSSIASASAAASPNGTERKPGVKGPKPARAVGPTRS